MQDFYLGLDIGGTKLRAVAVPRKPRSAEAVQRALGAARMLPMPRTERAFLRVAQTMLRETGVGKHIRGIGVGIPGMYDTARGVVANAPHARFLNGWRVRTLGRTFRVPVRFDNDSRCFLRAELAYGAARGAKNAAGVAFGTGIGAGIAIDGKIYLGAHASAGEFGHTIMSGVPLAGRAVPGRLKTFEELGGRRAYERYGPRNIVRGIGIANMINVLDPEIIVVGGGAAWTPDFDISLIRHSARLHIVSPRAKTTPIVRGALGVSAQALGAALLFDDY